MIVAVISGVKLFLQSTRLQLQSDSGEREKQTDRQIYGDGQRASESQTGRQRQTQRETDRQTDRQTEGDFSARRSKLYV